jgi:uncharacterized protein DUF4149
MRSITLLFVAAWLGSAIFFSSVVAPSAFSVLRAHQVTNASEIAGAIVNRSLTAINVSGFLIAVIALFIRFVIRSERRWFLVEFIALLVMAVMTAVGHWVIAARIRALRATLSVPIEQLGLNDPQRITFASLHRYSVIALSIAIIAALIASLMIARNAQS